MARSSRTSSTKSVSKTRKPRGAKGRNAGRSKGSIAPTAIRLRPSSGRGLGKELKEAREQQAATSEVLEAINRSGFNLDEILQTLVSTAARLCKTGPAGFFLLEGDVYRFRAGQNLTKPYLEHEKRAEIRAGLGTIVGRVALRKAVVQIADALEDIDYEDKEAASTDSLRSMLGVPLLRNGEPVGVFALARTRVEPFSESQVRLVSTFANQAVIAIENARLFDETKEALERQTATADILKVIASSPTSVEPVLNAIVDRACEVCEAADAVVYMKDGDHLTADAHRGPITIPVESTRILISRDWVTGRSVVDKMPVHVRDFDSPEGDDFPVARQHTRLMGHRAALAVPLLREGEAIGAIALRRAEVQPFTDKQISLLQIFADQAVIAIQNVQLFEEVQARTRELSESLQQQTATSEVLQVISSSIGN